MVLYLFVSFRQKKLGLKSVKTHLFVFNDTHIAYYKQQTESLGQPVQKVNLKGKWVKWKNKVTIVFVAEHLCNTSFSSFVVQQYLLILVNIISVFFSSFLCLFFLFSSLLVVIPG